MKKWQVSQIASGGYAVAPVFVVRHGDISASEEGIFPEDADAEIKRYEEAVKAVQEELSRLSEKNPILAAHVMLAGDPVFHDGVTGKIRRGKNAEAALMEVCSSYGAVFERMDDAYMKERAEDLKDVARRILCALKGVEDDPFGALKERSILVAKNLTPSDTAKIDFCLVAGLITEEGGVTSHVAIVAKNKGIPCLVGAGSLLDSVKDGERAILDAEEGYFYLDSGQALAEAYERKIKEREAQARELLLQSALPSETLDGHGFRICANAGSLEDLERAFSYPVEGIGLFRSEFLYMEADHFPTEEEQFAAYRQAALLAAGKEITIRTLDIGGDKGLSYYKPPKEENPFLGCRAIRMCLEQPELLHTQLRAVLRAGAYGPLRILYPMMVSLEELFSANEILEACKKELAAEGIPYAEKIPVGVMIETPAAVFLADEFARHTDFFSIGTNDLTQYILATDRGNPRVSKYYDPFHPAVLRAVSHTISAAHRQGIPAGMCGELAGNEKAAKLLLGMGLDEFSMSAGSAGKVKYALRNVSFAQMKEEAEKLLSLAGKP